jgi:hypothetical protein
MTDTLKKLLFLPILLTITCGVASAQDLHFGIRTGLSFASQIIDDPAILSTNSIPTYNISLFAEKPLRNDFYIQAALGLMGKGVTTYENVLTTTIQLTYIDIPVNLLYKFTLPNLGKLYVGGGPYLSAGISGNIQFQNTNNSSGQSVEFGSTKDYKRFDAGADLMVGFEFNNRLTFNTKYALELNNIAPDNAIDNVKSIKNKVFSIGLGFRF